MRLHDWKREEEKMKEISKGDVFTLPAKNVTQEMINHYADAAEDHNPLHIDPEFAKTTRYGGTIAHGMLSVAFIQELQRRNRNELYGPGVSGRYYYNGS